MAPKIPPGPLTGKRPNGEQVIAQIKKNESQEVVVRASILNGWPFIDIRLAFWKAGELHYTGKGITLKPGEPAQALIHAIAKAARELGDSPQVTNPAVTSGTPAVTSGTPVSPPPAPVASANSAPPPPASSNGTAREPVSETAKMMMKNNPGKTLEELNEDRVARGKDPMW